MLTLDELIAKDYCYDNEDYTLVDEHPWKNVSSAMHDRKAKLPSWTRPVDFTSLPPNQSSPALSDVGLTSTPIQRSDSLDENILDTPLMATMSDYYNDLGDFGDLPSFPDDHGDGLALFGGVDIHDQYGSQENYHPEVRDNRTPRVSPSRRHEPAFVLHPATPSPRLSPSFLT